MSIALLQGLPTGGNYTAETVDKVKELLNSGAVDVNDVSQYFSVPKALVVQSLTGIPPSAFTGGNLTEQQVDAVEKLVKTGVMSTPEVSEYFNAPPEIVERHLTDIRGYNPSQLAEAQMGLPVTQFEEEPEPPINIDPEPDTRIMGDPEPVRSAATPAATPLPMPTMATTQYATGSEIPTGLRGSEMALKGGATGAIEMLDQLNRAGRADLTTQYETGLEQAAAQSQIARGDITSGTTQGLNAIGTGFGQAREDIGGAYGRAEEMFNPYMQAGNTALQQQMALSGALGQDAFNQAYQESPQMAFLREQGMRANLSGAAATGGLGGGNVQKELQRFGQGVASQGLQQQISNLGALSSQGLGATGSAAGIATGAGTNLANLATGEAQARSNALMSQGSNLANIATGLGSQQLGTQTNLGNQLASYNLSTGLPAAQSISSLGTNLAAGRTRAGEQLAGQYGQTAGQLAGIYSGQGRDVAAMTDSQRQMLMNMVQSGAMTEAQAQQAYSTNMANLQSGVGSQLAGVPNAPIFAPDYGTQIGNAFQAGGIGAYLSGQQKNTPAPVSTSTPIYPNQPIGFSVMGLSGL